MAHANYTVSTSTSTESSGDSVNAGTIASSVVLIISPDVGYTVSASDFFIGDPLPVEVGNVVFTNTTTAGQYGNLVHATVVFNQFTMPSSNKDVIVDIDGEAREIVSVDPDINVCITDNVQEDGFCPDTSWPNQGDPTEPGGGGGPDNTNQQCLSQFVTTVEGTGITATNGTNTNWYNSLLNVTDNAYTTQHSGSVTPNTPTTLFTKTFWTTPQTCYSVTPTYSLNAAALASGYYTVQETPTDYNVDKTLTASVSNSNILTCDTTDVLPGMQVTGVDLLSCGDNMGVIATTVGGCYPWSLSDVRVVSVDHTAGTITITEKIVSLAIGDVLNFSSTLNLVSPNGLGAAPNDCLVKQFTVSFNGDTDVSCDSQGTGCEDGMDVAFIFDYTGSMYDQDVKAGSSAIITQIQNLMTNSSGVVADYQLSLTLADESLSFISPSYSSLSDYVNLPAAQKYVSPATYPGSGGWGSESGGDCVPDSEGNPVQQYITNVEQFSINNKATFQAKLNLLNTAFVFPMGLGVNGPEPTDIAIDKIANQAFGGSWRSNVAKYIILFTDALPGGTDDCFGSDDAAAMATLTTSLVAAGIKLMVVGPGVTIQTNYGYPWQDICDATGGIWDDAGSGDYSQAVIDNLATLCGQVTPCSNPCSDPYAPYPGNQVGGRVDSGVYGTPQDALEWYADPSNGVTTVPFHVGGQYYYEDSRYAGDCDEPNGGKYMLLMNVEVRANSNMAANQGGGLGTSASWSDFIDYFHAQDTGNVLTYTYASDYATVVSQNNALWGAYDSTSNSLGWALWPYSNTCYCNCPAGSSSSSSQSTSAHEIDFNNTSGPWNWNMGASPKITQVNLNTSNVSQNGEVRKLVVGGNSGVKFNTWLLDDDGRSYDFDTDTFTVANTFLNSQEIDSTGIFTRNIVFPATAKTTKTYDFTLSPTGGINDGNINTQPTLAPGVSGEISLSSYVDTTITLTSSGTGLSISSLPSPNTMTAEGDKVINAAAKSLVDTVTKSGAKIYYNDNHTPASGTTESNVDGDFEYTPERYSAEVSLQAAFTGSGTTSITSTISGRIIKMPTANTTLNLDYTSIITTTPNCYDSSFSLSLEDLATSGGASLQVHRVGDYGGISRGFADNDGNFDITLPLMTGHKDFYVVDASGVTFGTMGSNHPSYNDNHFYGNLGSSSEVDQILYLYSGGAVVGDTETFTYKCNDGTTDSAVKTCTITFIE